MLSQTSKLPLLMPFLLTKYQVNPQTNKKGVAKPFPSMLAKYPAEYSDDAVGAAHDLQSD